MASKGIDEMGLGLLLVVMLWTGAAAQPSCTNALMGALAPCLTYVTGNSSTPSPPCCAQLSTVVQTQPKCLCSLLNGSGPSLGVTVNQTLALSLPSACNVKTTAVGQCNAAASGPAAASAASPVSTPAPAESTPSETPIESPKSPNKPSQSTVNPPSAGAGSKTTGATSGGSTKSPLHVALLILFVVSCASTVARF